ncbi:MAG: amino acid adenylation domain-containing protein [Halanaerobiales bacterium]|nr:amino acid adenylation domain-containing protein [Halanaerobiales bacterium]
MTDTKVLKIFKATPMQNGMLYYTLLNEDSVNYHVQICFKLEGKINQDYLKQAWEEVIKRHECLRTDFKWKEFKTPIQIILEKKEADIYEEDISKLNDSEQKRYLQRFKKEDLQKKFDFDSNKLSRLSLVKLSSEKYFMCWTFHHLLLDGWSTHIIFDELTKIYKSLVNNRPLPAKPLAQFSDYLEWIKNQNLKQAKQFWQNYIQDVTESTLLPTDIGFKEGKIITEATEIKLELDKESTEEVKSICLANNITVNTFIQTAWGILLQKYNRTDISCYGMTVSGRPADVENVEKIAGLFINTLPVVIKTDPHETVTDLLKKVNKEILEIHEYNYMPLIDIKKLSKFTSTEEFFDSIVVFENYPINVSEDDPELGFIIYQDSAHELTNYDLTILAASGDTILLNMIYNNEVLSLEMMEQIKNNLHQLIKIIIKNPKQLVQDISIISKEEREHLLYEINDTKLEYSQEKTIHQLIEEQVLKTPEKVALVFKDKQLTYRELNEKSNQLARILRDKGVEPNNLVGIRVERSLEMLIGIIATLKAGGAFLPIDPELPIERSMYMLEDSNTQILLTQSSLEKISIKTQTINIDKPENRSANGENLENINKAQDLAYVIYTSGSTGRPKGVMIEHQAVNNFIEGITQKIDFSPDKTILSLTTISFDIFVLETFLPLSKGLKVVIATEKEQLIPEEFADVIVKNNVDIVQMTASRMQLLTSNESGIKGLKNLKDIIIGGENFPETLLKKLSKVTDAKIINVYGPTETTVWSTVKLLKETEEITIGKPIANTQIFVLDNNLTLLPENIPGELYISGDGIARGYLNRAKLTGEKFIPNPFIPGQMMYKTGDLIKLLSNGELQFLGRIDNQVKIRGYRIELGEIENQLVNHELIYEAVVIDRMDANQNKYLSAYLVLKEELSVSKLREYLTTSLPEYMIPSYFTILNKIPKLINGKINRLALPEPSSDIKLGVEYRAPRNAVEEKLVEIWKEVLGLKKVGIDDSFFDLGGDSIKAIQVIARSNQQKFNISVRDMLKQQTIANLWDNILFKEIDKVNVSAEIKAIKRFEPDTYPYYFPCIYGVIREKMRYETGYNVDMGYFMAGDGETLLGCSYILDNDQSLQLNYIDIPYNRLGGFPNLGERFGTTMDYKKFSSLEEGIKYFEARLDDRELIIVTGTSYFLNYTPDYHKEEDEWLEEMNRGRVNMIQLDVEIPHIFLLVERTEDSYIVYDSTYNFYGQIPKEDFHNAFTGLRVIEFMKGHPSYESSTPYIILELNIDNLKRVDIKTLGKNILREIIDISKLSKKAIYQNGDEEHHVQLGIEAINEIIRFIKILNEDDKKQDSLINYLAEIFNSWKYRYIFLKDFFDDFSKHLFISEYFHNAVSKMIDQMNELANNCEAKKQDLTGRQELFDQVIAKLQIIYDEQKTFFDKLEDVLKG